MAELQLQGRITTPSQNYYFKAGLQLQGGIITLEILLQGRIITPRRNYNSNAELQLQGGIITPRRNYKYYV
jgi:hypothetical protein